MKKKLTATALLLFITIVSDAQVQLDWVKKFVGTGVDNAAAIIPDPSGNVWVCGNNNWGSNTADIYALRFNSTGTQTAGFLYNNYPNADQAKAIASDAAGNIYVAGTIGKVTANGTSTDIIIIKYNSSAVQQWVSIFNTPQDYIDDVNSIAVDPSGNIYLAGSIVKTESFSYDYLTIKMNNAGVVQWFNTYDGTAAGVDIAYDVAVDASGNVFVTGSSSGQVVKRLGTVSTGYDIVTIKYTPTGTQEWSYRYNYSSKNDVGNSIVLNSSGEVFVTGYVGSSTTGTDCATLKFSNAGALQWVQIYNGASNVNDAANSIALDGSGNAIISGYANSGSGMSDAIALKYSTAGVLQWASTYRSVSNSNDVSNAMALDQFGNAYLAVTSSIPGSSNDFVTIRFNSNGSRAWAARYNGPENGSDYPTSIAVVNSNVIGSAAASKVYVYGQSANDVIVVKYSQPQVVGSARSNAAIEDKAYQIKSYHFPNPTRSYTNIFYEVPFDSKVRISVYDGSGRNVKTIADRFHKAGSFSQRIYATKFSSGNYYYEILFHAGGKELRQTNKFEVQR